MKVVTLVNGQKYYVESNSIWLPRKNASEIVDIEVRVLRVGWRFIFAILDERGNEVFKHRSKDDVKCIKTIKKKT